MKADLVLPSNIPWKSLKAKELEECIYWLLDSLGGKDLEWRVGGAGEGAADQGRDLEAHFFTEAPDGEIRREKWWLEAKGRSGKVEASAVKHSVINASGRSDVDVLVIACNSYFSNPTMDWVRDWQSSHPRPKVRLWDRSKLEKLLCDHPEVVVRMMAGALSPQGKLEVIRSRFWNLAWYSDSLTLRTVWSHRKELDWNEPTYIAVIASELANGEIGSRSWALTFSDERLSSVLAIALLNLPFFCARAEKLGNSERPYVSAVAYLLLVMLQKHTPERLFQFLQGIWEKTGVPLDLADSVLRPVLGRLFSEISDVCTSNCRRVHTRTYLLSKEEAALYMKRLIPSESEEEHDEDEEEDHFFMEFTPLPCNIGYRFDKDKGCPFVKMEWHNLDVAKLLALLRDVIGRRTAAGEAESEPFSL